MQRQKTIFQTHTNKMKRTFHIFHIYSLGSLLDIPVKTVLSSQKYNKLLFISYQQFLP